MFTISDKLYTAEQVRQLDQLAMRAAGVDEYTLMCRAGAAVVEAARARWTSHNAWLVVCGSGNNGGDGYVAARLARASGVEVTVMAVVDPAQLRGAAARAADEWRACGGQVLPPEAPVADDISLVIDALLGTGLNRPVSGSVARLLERLNALPCPRIAVDIPSGIHADTGAVMGSALLADQTVTFIGKKRGLYTADGPQHAGRVVFERLNVPTEVYETGPPAGHLLARDFAAKLLPPRSRNSHKGVFGHVLVVAGQAGMSGAARLAGEGALRVGAGLVTVATAAAHASQLNIGRPELMVQAVTSGEDLMQAATGATVLAVGPGLGTSDWAHELLRVCLQDSRPLVVDADGLNLLAAQAVPQRVNWVLTPHPGEAARLLDCDTASVQADRLAAAQALAERFQAVVLLKGSGSVLAAPTGSWSICASGNPGMATAGCGDVLTGVVAGLMAQGFQSWQAACVGAVVHGLAGDKAAEQGERGLLASDVARELRGAVNG